MLKMADAGEDHADMFGVGGSDDFRVADGAAGLDDGFDAGACCQFHII